MAAPDPEGFVENLRPALIEAARMARRLEGVASNDPKSGETSDEKRALTQADLATQEILLAALMAHHPGVQLAAEEETPGPGRTLGGGTRKRRMAKGPVLDGPEALLRADRRMCEAEGAIPAASENEEALTVAGLRDGTAHTYGFEEEVNESGGAGPAAPAMVRDRPGRAVAAMMARKARAASIGGSLNPPAAVAPVMRPLL